MTVGSPVRAAATPVAAARGSAATASGSSAAGVTVVSGRWGAVLAVGSAVPHAALTSGHGCAPTPLFALLNVLTLACLLCAWHLWTRPAIRVWVAGASMNLVMLAGHAVMMRTERHASGPPALLAWAALGSAMELVVTVAALRPGGMRGGIRDRRSRRSRSIRPA